MRKMLIPTAGLSGVRALNFAQTALTPGVVRIVANKAETAEVYIYGDIGGWFDGVNAVDVAKEIAAISAPSINVHINSGGGLVFDGVAIYNAIAAHKAEIIVHVDGLAASIASVIAMAGDEIRIGESANIMIHKPWSGVFGDAEAMRAEATLLDILEAGIVDIYAARTGMDRADLTKLVAAETWMRGQDAVDRGFADSVTPNKAPKEKKAARSALLPLYLNTPADLSADGGDIPKVREFERLLRDGEGQSNAYAKRMAAMAARHFGPGSDAPPVAPRDEGDSSANAALIAAAIRSQIHDGATHD